MSELTYAIGGGRPQRLAGEATIRLAAGAAIRFDLAAGGHWFGHGYSAPRQAWLLEAEPLANEHFAVNNCQSPIWMCSAGYAVLADTTAELAVRIDPAGDGVLAFVCRDEPIVVRVFHGADLPSARRRLMAHLGWPNRPPQADLLGDCIFCTWTQYPRCITQRRVVEMARAVRDRGYPCSTITIDDRWESAFGELTFSADFPDPAAMVHELHELGFRVLLWVTPFVNVGSAHFETLSQRGILVPRKKGQAASLFRWWGGQAGLIDLTRPAGRQWYADQLRRLRADTGVDGFKIDGGDGKYQPPPDDSAWADYLGPSGYSDALLHLFEEIAPGRCETRTMWLSQRRNILWRQGGKDSHWGADNGLAAMVRLGLHMALIGYDIFIPDMVPGRVQTMSAADPLPTDELTVRWAEATAFMPIMQFSYFPWNYAAPTANACLGYALAHKAIERYLVGASAGRSAPCFRPLFYDHPEIAELYAIGDEFLLGPDLLAAPVLEAGCDRRDVVLPPGRWRDAWTGEPHEAGRLADFPAPCPGIPLFVRADNEALFDALHPALTRIERGSVPAGVTTATWSAGLDRDLNVTG